MKAKTFTDSLNAYTIYIGSKQLGVNLKTASNKKQFNLPDGSKVTDSPKWLCFTEEYSLKKALQGEMNGKFYPANFPLDLLDNKYKFAKWLEKYDELLNGPDQWSIENTENITLPVLIKAKHSWLDGKKLPRGWVCHNKADLHLAMQNIKSLGFSQNEFFIQSWLESHNLETISVCGFYDVNNVSRNIQTVVRRLASYQQKLSCASAVETIDDEWQLIPNTHLILKALKFTGPYEMEFLVDQDSVKVLELNPRFWMQHAIFLKHHNSLLKRYYNMDRTKDWQQSELIHTIWIDSLELLKNIFRLRFKLLIILIQNLFKKETKLIIWPNLFVAIHLLLKRVIARLFY